ncbi:MAG: prepilin-type N-terminal cleavage/methylation domain-containing protein, partial [Fusobacterium sp.]|nr:prepilin-type N-terminal cleavage/methylation domain-containing protein [Fusobacterium sp.]
SRGFTMAEILLSLTIIGVVAAITLPSLTGNINERTWNTQRKALYARFSQAIALMPALNGYGTLTDAGSPMDNITETFVTGGLAKVLKINNVCDFDHLNDCGIPKKITALDAKIPYSSYSQGLPEDLYGFQPNFGSFSWTGSDGVAHPVAANALNTKAAAFETANGESIAVYYNRACTSKVVGQSDMSQKIVCANFVYDLNGSKGPNTVGKDIGFISVLYPTDSVVVAPMFAYNDKTAENVEFKEAGNLCKSQGDEYRLPNADELAAIFINRKLVGAINGGGYGEIWSSSRDENGKVWTVNFVTGLRSRYAKTETRNARCIKR